MLASKLTPLPLASLIAGETRREAWALFRGQAERKRPKETGAKDYKFTLAKRLAWRLRERLSLWTPRRVFQGVQQFYTGSQQLGSLARSGAPHSAGNRSARLRLTLGVLDDEE